MNDFVELHTRGERAPTGPGAEKSPEPPEDWLAVSNSPGMAEVVRLARRVAASASPVLILGETGAGKELLAEAVHAWSPRRARPFIKLNCSAIPEGLAESELFGHTKGAFSGAERARPGRFLSADGGTLLLDEVGDMPLSAQAKLLRVLQEGTFEQVGSDRSVHVDVRVVAATHQDLSALVRAGLFRGDLYYRIAVFPLHLPPLRERTEDIPLICQRVLAHMHVLSGRGPFRLSEAAIAALRENPWPGNVRELQNTLERATVVLPKNSGLIEPEHLGLWPEGAPSRPTWSEGAASMTYVENEQCYFEALLERARGKVSGPGGAAELAGLKPTTLRSKLARYGLP